jgi:hypothetical protein
MATPTCPPTPELRLGTITVPMALGRLAGAELVWSWPRPHHDLAPAPPTPRPQPSPTQWPRPQPPGSDPPRPSHGHRGPWMPDIQGRRGGQDGETPGKIFLN